MKKGITFTLIGLLVALALILLFNQPSIANSNSATTIPQKGLLLPSWKMNNPDYKRHAKGLVTFTHAKHAQDYQATCDKCHHDAEGQPLFLVIGDSAEKCSTCHKETKKVKGEKLSKSEKIVKYHKEALHANCIGCHKEFNIRKGDPKGKGPAPTSCVKCHPKKSKA